ncbi:MAG: ring-1,2-phenylacetyl-CoA epoxidase subunit PaaD [Alteromonadaceae bacterium]|jgi:ring-1,2-phenylacetyl-CoA epoxidase subunit PaaD
MVSEMVNNELVIPTLNPIFAQRNSFRAMSVHAKIWDLLDSVYDPELPGLTLWDLGVLQDVQVHGQQIVVIITPTYSGCPAVDMMAKDVVTALNAANYQDVKVKVTLAPAWCTDMISPAGKQQLADLHIAPPNKDDDPDCPVCHSKNTQLLSQFGSTACKALHQCQDCLETFDYFKSL